MAHLAKENKTEVAAMFKKTLDRDPAKGQQMINELLDVIMEPTHLQLINRGQDLGEWVKTLYGGGEPFEKFCTAVRVYDKSPYCGCVWTANFVAYRCKTCATSPCMSICAACFEKGDHEGHEYNIFRSEAGGACDCGDASVMKESGFCSQHGVGRVVPDNIPPDLLTMPKIIMERSVLLLLHLCRNLVKGSILESSFPSKIADPVADVIDVLIECMKLGSPIRDYISFLLQDEDYYTRLNTCQHYGGLVSEDMRKFHEKCHNWFPEACKRLPISEVPEEIKNKERFGRQGYDYKCLLQEFMFWTVRFEFQQPLILFQLNMLPDNAFKQAFARAFVRHYLYIAPSLSGALHVEQLSNRIVHISVQLFSNKELATTLAKEEGLLEVFMISLNSMVTNKLVKSETNEDDLHQCVATAGRGLRNNCYWAIVSDLVNCLGHNEVALQFLNNDDVMKCWMRILLCFSGMNLTSREMDKHVEYDPQNILLPFYSEREACAAPLWVLVDVLRDGSTLPIARKVIYSCLKTITELLDVLGVADHKGTKIPFNLISFHYPVHRYFALFVANAVSRQGLGLGDLQMTENVARRVMSHPLQVLCTSHEIQCNMWVRNGLNISTQHLAYKQSFFCTFFIDADLFFLQLCSCYMTPDIFISSIFDRCRVTNSLTVDLLSKPLPPTKHGFEGQPEDEKLVKMLESALFIITSAMSITTQLGISDERIIENELVALLSTQSWTHSALSERIPQLNDMHAGEKSRRFSEPLAQAIEQLSITVEGDAMTETKYALREEAWARYDPIFTAHRAMYKKDVQQSHTNYYKHLQRTNKLEPGMLEGNVWPPYKPIRITDERYALLNRVMNCRTLHTAIFMVLYKYINGHPVISEHTLVLAIHLLEGALFAAPPERGTRMEEDEEETQSTSKGSDEKSNWQRMLDAWFDVDNMATNIRQVIDTVQMPPSTEEVFHDAMETSEQLSTAPETEGTGQSSTEEPERRYVVQESIITILVKLHEKMTGRKNSFVFPAEFVPDLDPPNPVPPTGPTIVSKILLFAASKSPENQKVITEICGTTPPPVEQPVIKDPQLESERERRKKRAQEMQKRLLREFANKQKQFLEKAEMEMSLAAEGNEGDAQMNDGTNLDGQVDCVICGATAETNINIVGNTEAERNTSARNQIVGLICFVQSSSVLGFRTGIEVKRPMRPPGSDIEEIETCRSLSLQTTENLKLVAEKKNFKQDFTLGYNTDWEISPHISTCGHYLHVGCHQDYMTWVQRDETGYLRFESGLGFQCPVCRQTSNMVIPCNVVQGRPQWTEEQKKLFKTLSTDPSMTAENRSYQESLLDVTNGLRANVPVRTISVAVPMEVDPPGDNEGSPIDPPKTQEVSILTYDEILKTCLSTAEEILSQNRSALHKDALDRLDIRGVFRGQLAYDLNQLGGRLVADDKPSNLPVVSRKIPVGPLFHVICKVIRVTGDTANNEFAIKLWNQLNGVVTKFREDQCPLLLKDPFSLLIELCVALYPLTLKEYQTIVSVLYNLSLVQALVQISCKFSPEERRAWKAKCGETVSDDLLKQLDCLLGHVITQLPSMLFGEEKGAESQSSSDTQCYTSTVWSPQSVQSSLEELLLNYLRVTALFQFHVFRNLACTSSFPCASSNDNEFLFLANYLGMLDSSTSSSSDSLSMCTLVLKWPNSVRSTVTQWCKEVETIVSADREMSFQLLTRHRAWKQPSIVDVPPDYTQLFTKFRDIVCENCKFLSREPAMCLLCGKFVCYRGMCQHPRDLYIESDKSRQRVGPNGAAVHAKKCGNGTVALLNIHATTIIIIRGPRSCVWGTLYLDQHGEEDRGWKRGRKLLLKKERLKLLNHQWLNHMFDSSCKNWNMHRNQM